MTTQPADAIAGLEKAYTVVTNRVNYHFSPSATFNAYSYQTKACDADANVLVKNIEDKVVANCKDYYAEKFSNKPGTGNHPRFYKNTNQLSCS
jgi:hypothetical protein